MSNLNRNFVANSIKICGVFLLMASCGKNDQQAQQMPSMELPVSTAVKGNGLVSKEYPASVEGVTDVEIRPQVSGYLQKIMVDEGAYVKAGQPLFKIDDRIFAEQ